MEKLLTYFTPNHYNLEFNIDKHRGTARGRTTISGHSHKNIAKLHAKNLTIDRVTVNDVITPIKESGDIFELPVLQNADLTIVIEYHYQLNKKHDRLVPVALSIRRPY